VGGEVSVLVLVFVAVVLLVLIISVAARRYLLVRTGSIDLCWRDRLDADGQGWSLGFGKFDEKALLLYRSVSVLPVPARRLRRSELTLGARRAAYAVEQELLPKGSVIARCQLGDRPLELAMSPDAATGVMAWLEAVPPSNRATGRLRRSG
jgi:hypothetical protein